MVLAQLLDPLPHKQFQICLVNRYCGFSMAADDAQLLGSRATMTLRLCARIGLGESMREPPTHTSRLLSSQETGKGRIVLAVKQVVQKAEREVRLNPGCLQIVIPQL